MLTVSEELLESLAIASERAFVERSVAFFAERGLGPSNPVALQQYVETNLPVARAYGFSSEQGLVFFLCLDLDVGRAILDSPALRDRLAAIDTDAGRVWAILDFMRSKPAGV